MIKDKKILICSSSGGNGKNFIKGFRMQLDYLGSNVSEDYIIRTKKNGGDKDNFEQTLTKFYKQLNN